MRISDWSSDVCSSDLLGRDAGLGGDAVIVQFHDAVDVGLGALARNAQNEAAAVAEGELVDQVGESTLALEGQVAGPRPLDAGNTRKRLHHPLRFLAQSAHVPSLFLLIPSPAQRRGRMPAPRPTARGARSSVGRGTRWLRG